MAGEAVSVGVWAPVDDRTFEQRLDGALGLLMQAMQTMAPDHVLAVAGYYDEIFRNTNGQNWHLTLAAKDRLGVVHQPHNVLDHVRLISSHRMTRRHLETMHGFDVEGCRGGERMPVLQAVLAHRAVHHVPDVIW